MLGIERLDKILEHLRQHKSSTVAELSKKLYIGEASIRRDLEKLQSKGYVKRTYGGAVLVEGLDSEIPLYVRENENRNEKDIIGKLAAEMVNEGDVLILDSSSTTFCMVEYLKNIKNLTVITNGAKTAIALGELLHVNVFSTGGKLREFSLSYVGKSAEKFIENFYADKLFFSCRAISKEKGILDASDQEAELRKVMMKHCSKSVLLCDATKFETNAFYKICDIDQVHAVVTNKSSLDEFSDTIIGYNIPIITP